MKRLREQTLELSLRADASGEAAAAARVEGARQTAAARAAARAEMEAHVESERKVNNPPPPATHPHTLHFTPAHTSPTCFPPVLPF